MAERLPPIRAWSNVDLDRFQNEIVPLDRPAHLRSLVRDWPAARAGSTSARVIADYLKRFDNGKPVHAAVGEPGIQGRFFYRDDLTDVNFRRAGVTVTAHWSNCWRWWMQRILTRSPSRRYR